MPADMTPVFAHDDELAEVRRLVYPHSGGRVTSTQGDTTPRLWLLDKMAYYAERIGDGLGGPWYRLSRWAAERWRAERDRLREAA